MKKIVALFVLFFTSIGLEAQSLPALELNEAWLKEIKEKAPEQLSFPSSQKHKVLVFSLHTGFKHWVIPFAEATVKTIVDKVGGFDVTYTKDINLLNKKNLKQYDAVVLNNNCSIGDKRDMFWDVFKNDISLDSIAATKKAAKFEKGLLKYVKKGGGIMALHGAIVMQNKSPRFSEMMGGSFEYHPKQQKIEIKLVDATHPLVSAFEGKGFTHMDEPYIFDKAYTKKNFKPLLYLEASEIKGLRNPDGDAIRYVSWIKTYGKGRVFYSSPSHNAHSFSNPKLLRFFLDGLQFAVGDVDCDVSPLGI
ncbi:MAG: type 1 glutamine amidotransferase [Arcticibacterium sp.]|jgi:type 1 glutamine amidotransferase